MVNKTLSSGIPVAFIISLSEVRIKTYLSSLHTNNYNNFNQIHIQKMTHGLSVHKNGNQTGVHTTILRIFTSN